MKKTIRIVLASLFLICFVSAGFGQSPNPRTQYSPRTKPPKDTFVGTLRVVYPPPSNPEPQSDYYKIELDTGRISISIKFTESVDPSTVIVGQTLLLRFPKNRNATASLQWLDQNRLLIVRTDKTASDLGDRSFDYSLILKGEAKTPQGGFGPVVKSASGKILDGDNNRREGGNYVATFKGLTYGGN
jgi:hypothetical protein